MTKKPLALLIAGLLTFGAGCRSRAGRRRRRRRRAGRDGASRSRTSPTSRFTLPNGLTVVVHEDHKAPVVAVSIWYHVGSSYEPKGKTGFAHLFEHLMFQGSENHKDEYFKPFELAGATDQNGTTWLRPHQLLRDRADHRAGHGAVDGVRPHGPPARRDRPSRSSTSSAAWCRTRSARARTSPTAASAS